MRTICYLLFLLLIPSNVTQAQSTMDIIDKMSAAIRKIEKNSFEVHAKERFGNKYISNKLKFHIQKSPRKIYVKNLGTGVEALYVEGWNKNRSYINPNGFPWLNISLNVYSSTVLAENHHPVTDAGLWFVNIILSGFEAEAKRHGAERSSLYKLKGEVMYEGQACYKINIRPPIDFKYITYTTQKDQSLVELSRERVISDYLVRSKNRLSYFKTIKKGTRLTIPNTYASQVVVYIDKKTYLPVHQEIYDDMGLFEEYNYKNISTKPNFSSKEFTTDCPSYGF